MDTRKDNPKTPKSVKVSSQSSSGSYSVSLDKNSANLLKNSSSLDNLAKALLSQSREYSKITAAGIDLAKQLEATPKNVEKAGNSVARTFISNFETVASYAISKFQTAFNSVVQNYNDNLTGITVRMQQTNREYTKALRDSTDWIKEEKYKTQFSQIDFTNSLNDVLATGLRDIRDGIDGEVVNPLATNLARTNLVVNKLLPQLSTQTKAYTRMSKLMGDSFGKATTAIGQYTQQIYGAEGLEDNQLNELLETTYRELAGAIAKQGGTQDDFNTTWTQIVASYSEYADRFGSEYATNMLSALKSSWTNEDITGGDVVELYAADKSGVKNDKSSDAVISYFENYTDKLRQLGQGDIAAVSNLAGLKHYNDMYDIIISDRFSENSPNSKEALAGFNYTDYFDKLSNQLQNGQYQSITAQQEKWNENTVSGIADIASEYIPDVTGVLNVVRDIISQWYAYWKISTVSNVAGNLFKNGSGSLKSLGLLTNGATIGETLASQIGTVGAETFMSNGSGFASGMSQAAAIGRSSLSILGKLAGAAGMAAGGYMAYSDSKDAYQRAQNSGTNATSAALNSFFTGSTTTGMSSDEKSAYYEQTGYKINLKDALSNGGKYAAIGGGAGTLAGGPMGTLIGTVAGGAVGMVTNVIDQAVEMSDFKKFNEAISKTTESIEALSKANSEYDTVMNKSTASLNALDILTQANGEETVASTEALSELKNAYPEYTKNINKVSDLDSDYIDLLKAKIEREQYLNEKNAYDNWSNNQVTTKGLESSGLSKDYTSGVRAFADSYDLFTNENGYLNQEKVVNWINSNYKTYRYNSPNEFLSDLSVSGILPVSNFGDLDKNGNLQLSDFDKGISGVEIADNGSGFNTDKYDRETKQIDDKFDSGLTQLASMWDILENSYLLYNNDGSSKRSKSKAKSNIESHIDDFTNSWNALKQFAIDYGIKESRWDIDAPVTFPKNTLEAIYNIAKKDVPKYLFGSDLVHQGLAWLDNDEAVLTSTTANQLRSLAGGQSLSNYINLLYGATANVTGTPETSAASDIDLYNRLDIISNAITRSIENQTETLVNYLTNAVSLLNKIANPTGAHNSNLVNYKGVS